MKITYLGEPVYLRNHQGRFRKSRLAWCVVILFVAILAIFNVGFNKWYATEVSYSVPVYAGVTMEGKVEDLKKDILDRLMTCESAGHNENDGIIIFDSNNLPSIGQFQFQKKTIVHYYKELYNLDVSLKDAIIIALDTAKARELASDIIFKTKGGVWNWKNCAEKTQIIPEITVLKKLTQD